MNDSQKIAQKNYAKKCRFIQLRLNQEKEPDIITWIDSQDNVTGKIKDLIRSDIERGKK